MAAEGERSSYRIPYKLQIVDYTKKHDNGAAAMAFGPLPMEKIISV